MNEPQPPPETRYTAAFERCWKQHSVGVKKTAFKAGEKAGWTDSNWDWLALYLERRHKDDVKWLEGTYIPHLSSIINGERWTDPYKRKSKDRWQRANEETQVETPEEIARKISEQQARFEEARKQNEKIRELRARGLA